MNNNSNKRLGAGRESGFVAFLYVFLLVASLHVPIRLSERGFEGCFRRRSQLVDSGFSSGARRIIYRVLRCDGGVGRTDRGRKMDLSELGTDGPTEALGVGVCVCAIVRPRAGRSVALTT